MWTWDLRPQRILLKLQVPSAVSAFRFHAFLSQLPCQPTIFLQNLQKPQCFPVGYSIPNGNQKGLYCSNSLAANLRQSKPLDRICPMRCARLASMEKLQRSKVILEPELEIIACTFTSRQRVALAVVFERWSHQLRVSAKILDPPRRSSPPRLRPLARQQQFRN